MLEYTSLKLPGVKSSVNGTIIHYIMIKDILKLTSRLAKSWIFFFYRLIKLIPHLLILNPIAFLRVFIPPIPRL